MNKYIIITSIFGPTEAVKKFAVLEDWKLVVVGDKKTPVDWNYKNVIYISPDEQLKLYPEFTHNLPWNSYCRKMTGYLYAIKNGAEVIADTDDDNIPYKNWGETISFEGVHKTIKTGAFINVYKEFTADHVWPRGFPLNRILEHTVPDKTKKNSKIGIWQFLADEDPDVDAIYRLTNNKPIYFEKNDNIILEKNTVCPFNSQNTFFRKELFPLLYLPAFVTFRYTDILRGLVAQPLMWEEGFLLGFGKATVIQKRNPHNYLKDFESEIPCYLYPEKVIEIIKSSIKKKASLKANLLNAYTSLLSEKIINRNEIELLKLWLEIFR